MKGLLFRGVGLIALIDAAFSLYRGGNRGVGRPGARLRCLRERLLRWRLPRPSPPPTPGPEPAGPERHRELGRQLRDLGRDIRRLLRGADPAARGHGSSRPVGRPHPRQPRRAPYAPCADPHGPARADGAAPARPGGGVEAAIEEQVRGARGSADAGALCPRRPARAHDLCHGACAPWRGRDRARHQRVRCAAPGSGRCSLPGIRRSSSTSSSIRPGGALSSITTWPWAGSGPASAGGACRTGQSRPERSVIAWPARRRHRTTRQRRVHRRGSPPTVVTPITLTHMPAALYRAPAAATIAEANQSSPLGRRRRASSTMAAVSR